MSHRTLLCGLLLAALAGCGAIPQVLRIEIDDRVIELKPKPAPEQPAGAPQAEPEEGDEPGR